ncbi:hypothetical protein ACQ4WX_47715 [Streptomyces lasalocidi]
MKGSLWLAWRQQRVSAGIGAAALVVAVAVAVYYRSGMLDALHSGLFDHCATGPLYCTRSDTGLPLLLDVEPLRYLGVLNIALPVVIGVFWGAPLLGRDRELGTHRLVLAQGVSRGQWFASRFALAAATTSALSGLLAGVFSWWWRLSRRPELRPVLVRQHRPERLGSPRRRGRPVRSGGSARCWACWPAGSWRRWA